MANTSIDFKKGLPVALDFKQQRVEARRNQILMGAAEVFARKGYHKATTRAIAKAAGVSEGTIYNYFNNKRELLVAMIELVGMQSLKNIITADPPPDNPQALLAALLHDRYRLMEERGYLLAPLIAEIFADVELRQALYQQVVLPVSGYIEKYIQAQIDSGRFGQANPIIVTRALIGAMLVNFALKLTGLESRYRDITPETMIEQLTSLFLNGLLSGNHQE